MLENLFVKYEPKLVELLWQKDIFTPLESKKIRDDLTYLLPQLVNYWVSFAPDPKTKSNDNQDLLGLSELLLSTCATDLYFANSCVFTLLSSFFPNHPDFIWANLKIQTLVSAILLVGR